ncbi:MAG: hypothetical protein K2K97_07380 [Muribaculaceae bacterium]|nr:hypothetical protein [Muribaculaceae bacterium]
MNKLVSIIRVVIVLALSLAAFLFLFGVELDKNTSAWMFHFIIDKALAFLAIFVIVRLYMRWSKTDPWFIAYDVWCKNVDEAPNPMCIKNEEG